MSRFIYYYAECHYADVMLGVAVVKVSVMALQEKCKRNSIFMQFSIMSIDAITLFRKRLRAYALIKKVKMNGRARLRHLCRKKLP